MSKDYTMTVLKRGRWVLRVAGAIGAYKLITSVFAGTINDFTSKSLGWGYSILLFGITLAGVVIAQIVVDMLVGRLIKKLENQE